MKKLFYSIVFISTFLIPFFGTAQNHWVLGTTSMYGVGPRFLSDVNNNYTLVNITGTQSGGSSGPIEIKSSSANGTGWNVTNSDAFNGTWAENAYQVSYFIYNGQPAIAYIAASNSELYLRAWDPINHTYNVISSSIAIANLSNFSVAVNPITNDIYVAYAKYTSVSSIGILVFDGSNWTNPIANYIPTPNDNYSGPSIHFDNDTLYLAGIASLSGVNKMAVYKQKYTNFSIGTLIPVAMDGTSQNVDSYAMDGEPGNKPYFIGYAAGTGALTISKINNNVISFLNNYNIGNQPGGVSLNLDVKGTNASIVVDTDDGNGTGDLQPFYWNGSTINIIFTSSLYSHTTGEYLENININKVSSGRSFITFDNGSSGYSFLYATNNPPTVTNNTPNEVCAYANNDFVFDNFTFQDLDGDSVVIIEITSNNSSVMPDGIGSYTITPTSSTANTNSYKIGVYPGSDGTADLTIKYTDGYDTLTTAAINITVKPQPTISLQTSDINICSNATDFTDLNPYSSPYSGKWVLDYDTLLNNLLDPSLVLNSQELSPIIFIYTDISTGCSSETYFYTATVEPPVGTITTTSADCGVNNGAAQLSISLGDSPLKSILWSPGFHDSLSLSGFAPGQYFVTITDSNDCRNIVPVNIGVNGLNVTTTTGNIDCNGGNNGFIHLNISGQGAPFTYLWSNGKSTLNIDNLVAGTYDVIITSATGCQTSKTFVITQPDKMSFPYNYDEYSSTCGNSDGTLEISTIVGGAIPYSFLWSNGVTTQTNSNIPAGLYSVVVTDANGCTAQVNCALSDYDAPDIYTDNIVQPSCNLSNGKIVLGLYGGDPVQSILWSNGSTNTTNSNLAEGNYTCEVTTTTGCKSYGEFDLITKAPMQNNICLLTVDSASTTNLVVWEKVETNVDHYNIYREGSTAGQYMLIDTVSGMNHSIFNDVVASPKTRAWRYKISAVNQCGVESQLSLPHKTVHLVISQSTGSQYNIVWDDYVGFSYSTVNLWRYTYQNGWELVSALPSNIYSYTDDLGSIAPAGIDYMIEIAPQTPCSPDKAQDYNSSRSNKANSIMIPGAGTGASNNSIDEYGKSLPIKMYPNPTSAILNIVWDGEATEYQILDIQGKVIAQSTLNTGKSTVDLSNVLPGIYFIQINGTTNKIIVQ